LINTEEKKVTQLRNFFLRDAFYLRLFLQFLKVNSHVYFKFIEDVGLEEGIFRACKNVDEISFRVEQGSKGKPVSVDYLSRICAGLPALTALTVEDSSDNWDESGHRLLTKLHNPRFVEVRSGRSKSKLTIGDNTLLYLAGLEEPLDCVVLSTNKSAFSLKAVRSFLETAKFVEHGLLELYYIDCTTNDFFKLLTDMRIPFESEPLRGIYNSFPINLRQSSVCLNIKYFSDSRSTAAETYFA